MFRLKLCGCNKIKRFMVEDVIVGNSDSGELGGLFDKEIMVVAGLDGVQFYWFNFVW